MTAHQARARVAKIRTAEARRQRRWKSLPGKVAALHTARARSSRIARAALRTRKQDLEAAIRRLERTGVGTALSSHEQQRRTTIPAGPRAARLRALQRALERRIRVNPRKARKMKMKRNRLGRFVKAARRRIGRAISGETVRRRRKKKSRASKARRRRNPTQGASMSRALVANPRRKRRRARRAPTTTRRRRRRHVAVRNPRRRRRHHHHRGRHRRNPGMGGGFIKAAMGSLLPMGLGGLGGAVCGLADAKFMSDKPVVSALSKVALGALGAALLRKRPALASGWAGGVMGSFGYSMGVKAAGGLVAHSPTTALKGIADMAQDNPEMAALLEGLTPDDGVGDITDDMGDAGDYAEALQGSDDGDGVGDIVEAD
jgi:hypothetical protein